MGFTDVTQPTLRRGTPADSAVDLPHSGATAGCGTCLAWGVLGRQTPCNLG